MRIDSAVCVHVSYSRHISSTAVCNPPFQRLACRLSNMVSPRKVRKSSSMVLEKVPNPSMSRSLRLATALA